MVLSQDQNSQKKQMFTSIFVNIFLSTTLSFLSLSFSHQYSLSSQSQYILSSIQAADQNAKPPLQFNNFLLLKYYMSSQSNNSSMMLLSWVNSQLTHTGVTPTVYNFQQLKNTNFVYQLMQKIHCKYFCLLNHYSYQFSSYLAQLESYLIDIEGKKLSRSYKKMVIEKESVQDILKIVLFLLLQSQHKTDFISRIVELPFDLQTFLMQELKTVNNSLQNCIEIKDILTTVQKLEEENEELKQKLKHYSEVNNQLNEVVLESKHESSKFEKEVHKYQNEKRQLMQQLQIVDMKEYIEIYRNVKQQNEELNYCIQQIDQNKREVQAQNESMRQKINHDCQIITTLHEQIAQVKCNFQVVKQQMCNLSFNYQQRDSFQQSVLRQNQNINNTSKRMRQSLQTTCSMHNSTILSQLYDEQDQQNVKLRMYNQDIMQKLENAYRTITDLTNQVSVLKQDKIKLEKRNGFLQRKIGDIKKEQSRFMKELRNIGF